MYILTDGYLDKWIALHQSFIVITQRKGMYLRNKVELTRVEC